METLFTYRFTISILSIFFYFSFPTAEAAKDPTSSALDPNSLSADEIFENYLQNNDFENKTSDQPEKNALQKEALDLAEKANALLEQGKINESLTIFQRAWEMDPSLTRVGALIAIQQIKAKNFNGALSTAVKLQNTMPTHPLGYNLAGIALLNLNDKKQAKLNFEKALQLKPGDPDTSANLAELYLSNNELDLARDLYKKSLVNNPNHYETLLRLVEFEFKYGNKNEALSFIQKTIENNPNELNPKIILAKLHLANNETQKALEVLKPLQNKFPGNVALLELIAVTELKTGRPSDAAKQLEEAVRAGATSDSVFFNLALAYEWLGKYELATEQIEKALKINPQYLPYKFLYASLMADQNKLDKATTLLDEISKIYPDEPEINIIKGQISLSKNAPNDAVIHFEKALKKQASSKLIIQLAGAQMLSKQIERGYQTLNDWLKIHPDDFQVRSSLATLLLAQKEFSLALSEYQELVNQQPENVNAINNLAWLFLQKGDKNSALRHIKTAYKLAPNNPQVADTYGAVLLANAQTKEAEELLKKAHTSSPDNLEIQLNLSKALIQNGKSKEAISLLNNLQSNHPKFADFYKVNDLIKSIN